MGRGSLNGEQGLWGVSPLQYAARLKTQIQAHAKQTDGIDDPAEVKIVREIGRIMVRRPHGRLLVNETHPPQDSP
jgi:hypothetical protein